MKSGFCPDRIFAAARPAFAGFNLFADAVTSPPDYPVQPVPFTAVHRDDVFRAPLIETNRAITIPHAFGQGKASGRTDNFERAAKASRGGMSG
jgi:hypothetical protein